MYDSGHGSDRSSDETRAHERIAPGRQTRTERIAPTRARSGAAPAAAVQAKAAALDPAWQPSIDPFGVHLQRQATDDPRARERAAITLDPRKEDSITEERATLNVDGPILSPRQLASARRANPAWWRRLRFNPAAFGATDVASDDFALAVAQFQRAHGLSVDGVAGPHTVEAASAAPTPDRGLHPSAETMALSPEERASPAAIDLRGEWPEERATLNVDGPVQSRAATARAATDADTHAIAARGVAGSGRDLPHGDAIRAGFGRHAPTLDGVSAHVGGPAATAATAIGAQAYATGTQLAFAAAPDLHTAAHEAAHVVQQRAGVSLKGGLGQAGDRYERNADAVADAIVAGHSAEALLGSTPGTSAPDRAIQRAAPTHDGMPDRSSRPALELVSSSDVVSQRAVLPTTPIGHRGADMVRLRNVGDAPIGLDSVEIVGNPAFDATLRGTNVLAPGRASEVDLGFVPVTAGVALAELRVTSQDGGGLSFPVEGRGYGAAAPAVASAPAAEPPAAASTKTSPDLRLILPDEVKLGEVVVGEDETYETTLWNTGAQDVLLRDWSLDQHPNQDVIRITAHPDRLLRTSDPNAIATGRLSVTFMPTQTGEIVDTLRFEVVAIDGSQHRAYAIPVRGRGRAKDAEFSHDEEERFAVDRAARQARDATEAAEEQVRQQRAEANFQNPTPYPQGTKDAMDRAADDVMSQLDVVDSHRKEGVTAVEAEVNKYAPAMPKLTPSTLDRLLDFAATALTLASWYLVGDVGATAKVVIGDGGKKVVEKLLEKAFGEEISAFRSSMSPDAGGPRLSPEGLPDADLDVGAVSSDPAIAYFTSQIGALTDSLADRKSAMRDVLSELSPLLREDPAKVQAALGAMKAALKAQTPLAAATQARTTTAKWLSFVASHDAGEKTVPKHRSPQTGDVEPETRATDLRGATTPPQAHHGPDAIKGLVDISFDADLNHPEKSVTVTSAKITGMPQAIANRLATMNVLELGVPVRAIGAPNGASGQEVLPITITRNEAGEIEVVAGTPGMPESSNLEAQYLAKKHDPRRGILARPADVKAGARVVIEGEILKEPLKNSLPKDGIVSDEMDH